jgi:carbonic anhydrase
MENAQPALENAFADATVDAQTACELEAVKLSLSNLLTFPWIRDRVSDETLHLHGATFDIRSGALSLLESDGRFAPV